jgi:PAS domain S-box-containing protein
MVNPRAREAFGYEPDELRGRLLYELFYPDETARVRRLLVETDEGAG